MTNSEVKPLFQTLLLAVALLTWSGFALAQSPGTARKRSTPGKPRPASTAAFNDLVNRADEARLAGRLEEAATLYVQALRQQPKWPEGWWYVGTILYEKDRYAEARDAFRNVVSLNAKEGAAWGMLGLCEFQTREYERAVVSLQRGRVLGLAGNQALVSVVRYHTALVYIRLEQFEIAFDILREFLREGNESQKVVEAFGLTMLRLPFLPNEVPPDKREQVLIAGRAGFNLGARRLDEARKAFDELLARYPDTPSVHYSVGIFLLNQDADAALEEFRKELKTSPNHVPAMLQMAFEYLKRNEYETALPLAEKSVQLAPKLFPARNALGRILLELGQVERAMTELETGVKLAPESPEMHFALARVYAKLGRKEDAARERATFQRLEKLYREQRDGKQTTGESEEKPPQ